MNKIEKVQPSHIFTNYIYKAIPLAFDESMSYYETLCGVLDLLHTHTEVINNNAELLAQLESYVTNYFENLDVQEEINNKLDEMAEDGTLENLIGQYIELATTYVYNTVAEMKEATNLVNGSFARTSGFHSYDDKGGAYYKVRTVTTDDVIDEKTIIALSDNTLIAELRIEKTMSPKQFGAYGDNEHDDTLAIQTCLNNCDNVLFDDSTYLINAITHIYPQSNTIINLSNATLKAITNDQGEYSIIRIEDAQNVKINNGTLQGDRDTHTGATGEWGHCIWIQNSTNIEINGTNLINAWGDGLYLYSGTNIKTSNLHINNTRRNGISVISANGYKSTNDYIENINGTAPQAAVDIEPNLATDLIDNIIFDNLTCYNTVGDGIDVSLQNVTTNMINVTFNNPHVKTCNIGIATGFPLNSVGNINIINPHIENAKSYGIKCSCPYSINGVKTNIINPYISNFNTNNTSNVAGIMLTSNNTNTWGNVIIKNPYVITSSSVLSSSLGIILGGYNGGHPVNVILDTPLNKQLPIFNSYGENIKITDPLEYYTVNTFETNGLVQNNTDVNTVYTNADREEGGTCIIRDYTSIGLDTKFIKLKDNRFSVKIPGSQYCYSVSQSAGPTISLVNIGDSITLRRINSTTWIIVNMVGTPTIS